MSNKSFQYSWSSLKEKEKKILNKTSWNINLISSLDLKSNHYFAIHIAMLRTHLRNLNWLYLFEISHMCYLQKKDISFHIINIYYTLLFLIIIIFNRH